MYIAYNSLSKYNRTLNLYVKNSGKYSHSSYGLQQQTLALETPQKQSEE